MHGLTMKITMKTKKMKIRHYIVSSEDRRLTFLTLKFIYVLFNIDFQLRNNKKENNRCFLQ